MQLRKSKFLSIAISGPCYTGKSTLSNIIANNLGWTHVNVGQEIRNMTFQLGLKLENFGSIPKEQLYNVDKQIQQRMKTEFHKIWDGRLCCYLAKTNESILKIFCTTELEIRIKRMVTRDIVNSFKAKELILSRDQEERNVFQQLYYVSNIYDDTWSNLKIDTSSKSPQELSKFIIDNLE